MSASTSGPSGPDFAKGLAVAEAPKSGVLAGHVGEEPVLLSCFDGVLHAIGGACTHYGGELAKGLVVGDTVRCPLHHACFSLRTGEALAAPAFDSVDRWRVEIEGETLFIREKLAAEAPAKGKAAGAKHLDRVVIVGGGAAGFAAAEMLRRRGFEGGLTLLSADEALPCDRPNLSKDYLAGEAPEAWIPLKDEGFYRQRGIDLRLGMPVTELAVEAHEVLSDKGERFGFDALLLATGSEPVRFRNPGFDLPSVHVLRSLADARAIIAATKDAKRAVVLGASFIGLETAASLRARGLEVHVVAPEAVPLEKVLGAELGGFVRRQHEQKGVIFHLRETVESFVNGRARLSGGGEIAADFVVLGVGVTPRLHLAVAGGLAVDKGVVVDQFLETDAPGIFAAGDIASYPYGPSGERIRVEHWVAAERQGQAAAKSMLGERRPFTAPPFFWSMHYDVAIRYVGHSAGYDDIKIDGSIEDQDATVRFLKAGRTIAAASVGRDKENLQIAAEMESAADR